MAVLLLLGLAGFGAQLINGSLGMGYGVTSTSVLLAAGTTPALASATVNFSQVGSQLASGYAHWRFGNVDWWVVRRIAAPGAFGAFVGALFLAWLSTELARPLMAVILLALGCYILVRFTVLGGARPTTGGPPMRTTALVPIGLVGGFLNSIGGGGWGPVGTSALLATGRIAPRMVIGSISAAEFAVVTAGSAGFLIGLGLGGINLSWVAVMLGGGILAAPLAAWMAKHVPSQLLGTLAGGLIVVTNARSLMDGTLLTLGPSTQVAVYASIVATWASAIGMTVVRAKRRDQVTVSDPSTGR